MDGEVFPLLTRHNKEVPSERWNVIHKIFAKVESERLIHIRLIVSFPMSDENGKPVTHFHATEITYSGNFTIWWACNESDRDVHGLEVSASNVNEIIETLMKKS